MSWLVSALKGLFSFATALMQYLNNKKLLDAGSAEQAKETLSENLEDIKTADAIKSDVDYSTDGVLNDKNNRDN